MRNNKICETSDICHSVIGGRLCRNCSDYHPFDLTASEAFAKANVGDTIEHEDGESIVFDPLNGVMALRHDAINERAFRVRRKAPPAPQYRSCKYVFPNGAKDVILIHRGGAEIKLTPDIIGMSYLAPVL